MRRYITIMRDKSGISKSELARRANVSRADISKIEKLGLNGFYTGYRCQRERIAAALGYLGDPDDLLRVVDDD